MKANYQPEDWFVVTCPLCWEPVVLERPKNGHKCCPLCHKPFNVVNGEPENPPVVRLVDTKVEYHV